MKLPIHHARSLKLVGPALLIAFAGLCGACGMFGGDGDDDDSISITSEEEAAEQAESKIDDSNYAQELDRLESDIANDEKKGPDGN